MNIEFLEEEIEFYDSLWHEWKCDEDGDCFSKFSLLLNSGLSQEKLDNIFSILKISVSDKRKLNKTEFFATIRLIGLFQHNTNIDEVKKSFFSYSKFIKAELRIDEVLLNFYLLLLL
jgi:hypothetical protein